MAITEGPLWGLTQKPSWDTRTRGPTVALSHFSMITQQNNKVPISCVYGFLWARWSSWALMSVSLTSLVTEPQRRLEVSTQAL